jgi:hypothetical protein
VRRRAAFVVEHRAFATLPQERQMWLGEHDAAHAAPRTVGVADLLATFDFSGR